jgi:hypothetical protein
MDVCSGCDKWVATHITGKAEFVYRAGKLASDVDPFSDAAAFDSAQAVPLQVPKLWPGAAAGGCTARVMYSASHLWLSYSISGGSFVEPCTKPPSDTAWAEEVGMPEGYWPILDDDRVELFLWAPQNEALSEEGEHYHAIEMNKGGSAIQMKVGFRKNFDWNWDAVGVRSQVFDGNRVVMAVPWGAYGIDAAQVPAPRLRMALCRGERSESRPEEQGVEVWSSWVDPGDDEVDFHRSACFGELLLE